MHNTIGARNYALFIAFMFCGLVAIPLDAALCLEYLLRVGRNGWVRLPSPPSLRQSPPAAPRGSPSHSRASPPQGARTAV